MTLLACFLSVTLPNMSLDEFIKAELARLERFLDYWRKQNAQHPDLYPLDIKPGDWDEQLAIFEDDLEHS